jgi:peptidoglycan/LPS O-acetylase OafA/YrhL
MDNKRISELDSLRGIAAFTVLINHCLIVYPALYELLNSRDTNSSTALKYLLFSPIITIWNGHAAVILFFILSGFVLSVSHYNNSTFNYSSYLIKRIVRLYIPYFVIITISVILINYYLGKYGMDHLSARFNETWTFKINLTDYIKLLLLRGKINIVNSPLWTVIIEIEISVILPIFIIIIKKINFIKSIILVILCIVCLKIVTYSKITNFIPDLIYIYYLQFFLFGSILYKYRSKIKSLEIKNVFILAIVFIVILFFYNWEWLIVWAIKYDKQNTFYAISDYMIAIGCILLMTISISNTCSIKKILNNRITIFLGKISFSLYLIHQILILFMVYSFRLISYNYLLFIIIAISLPVSFAYYYYIEQPAINLGAFLAKSFKKNIYK